MASRRKRLLLLIPLLLIAGTAAWIGSFFLHARRTMAAHALQCRAFLQTFPPESADRPPILDHPEPGDAWELELQAISRITGSPLDLDDAPLRLRLAGLEEKDLPT